MSLKQRLAARERPTDTFRLRMVDDTTAQSELAAARSKLRQVSLKHGPDHKDVKAAQRKVKAAEKTVQACFETITFRAMRAPDYEALIAAHEPTPQQKASQPDLVWNPDTFPPALLAECVLHSDLTAEDWAGVLVENLSPGERRELIMAVGRVHEQARAPEASILPKELLQMLASRSS